ncbi:MAG: DNA translocase FtsK 4TM domain-containing protein [Rhodospirillales bacterium]|nr:DNA translocase FtsK 4TM domain-containing protein [Rhodospirillales bacterium]MCB9996130.1 DNA translocase FtsK 4TM domain-containing protein [Rhodospirillales bacterium]
MGRYAKVVKKKKKKNKGFLPESIQIFIARRLIDGTALALILTGLALLAAIASYAHTDPSWNTATDAPEDIANWLGLPGAHIADLLLQTIGLAGAVCGVILTLWGARIWRRHSLSPFWKRFAGSIVTILFAAIAFARIPAGSWLVHPYLGGSGGTLMMDSLAGLIQPFVSGNEHSMVAIAAGLLAFLSLNVTLAVSRAEWGFVLHSGWVLLCDAFYFTMDKTARFADWLRHYGDAGYEPPVRKREPKITGALKITPRKAPPLSAEAEPPFETAPAAPAPPRKETAIKVVNPQKKPQSTATQSSFALDPNIDWELPPVDLLQAVPADDSEEQLDEAALRQNAELLQNVLSDFNVSGEIVSIHPGPVVTLYEFEPSPGTKTARVISLADDIARSMSAISVRCAVIPGRNVIGIEMPNARRQTVYLRELLETQDVQKTKAHLPLILGKDIGGAPVVADLAKMPHLLIAGTTGSGKSVAVNTMILSLVYSLPPEKCRMIMIDPKMLELSVYDDIPHLLSPVVTEPGKAVVSLKWAVQEMENRYRAMSRLGVRNIEGYNARLAEARKKGETMMRKVQTGFDPDSGKPVFEEQPMDTTELPYIVIVVDEFADLMLVAGKDVENAVQRLAQMARAAGIHLLMATQRPSTDVITGVIKANFPTRISFQVTSVYDSRTILGETGAEQLLGMGDMLYMAPGGRIQRVHGPFVGDDEVEAVVGFLKDQGEPQYLEDVTEGGDFGDSEVMAAMFGDGDDGDSVDELYDQAVALVARERKASTSFIQRYLQIGYNRAARIIEEMERQGVVSKATATGKREVLVGDYSDA